MSTERACLNGQAFHFSGTSTGINFESLIVEYCDPDCKSTTIDNTSSNDVFYIQLTAEEWGDWNDCDCSTGTQTRERTLNSFPGQNLTPQAESRQCDSCGPQAYL